MDPLAPGNPLSPDSQAFMDLLERHLSEHDDKQRLDVPAAGTDMSSFPGMMNGGYTSFSAAGDKQPVMTPTPGSANAPSPNTMAALINILQVQAQASGADPQAQQRQLVNLLNNMPWNPTSTTPNNPQLDAFAASMMSQPAAQTNVHPSQLYSQPQPAANQYPYPGIDTPEHSGPGSSSALKHGRSGTESNGNTPPATQSSAGSSPEALIGSTSRVQESKTAKQVEEHVKRKAGDEEIEGHQSHRTRHASGGDSHDDDSDEEHDGSPPTGKKSTSKRSATKASRRKSGTSGIALDAIVTKGDEDLDAKALKRKNQNRAAQKAFRERREARVKDLEDKVNELEAKNAGNEFENENLRQLLAKLQQENVALKTAAFTFSMPMPQTAQQGSSTSPVGSAHHTSQSPPETRRDTQRLPHPPQPQPIQHRGESTSSSASGVSNTVRSSSGGSVTRSPAELSSSVSPFGGARPTGVFNPEPYNAFASSTAPGNPATVRTVSPVEQHASSSSSMGRGSFTQFSNPSNGGTSLMQRVAQASPQNMTSSTVDPTQGGNDMDWQSLLNNNFTMLAQAPEFMSFSDDAAFGNFGGYSDIWPGFSNADLAGARDVNMSGIQSTLVNPSPAGNQFNTIHSKPSGADDALLTMADDNMEEFLRSLGAGQTPAGSGAAGADDDVFDMNFGGGDDTSGGFDRQYLSGLKNASGSSLSSAPSMLSPNNFFTTSPDPSSASSVSPLNPTSKHASASPDTVASDSSNNSQAFRVGTFGGRPGESGPQMVQKDGTVVNCNKLFEQVTSRIPINSGFDLDDLCDHFKKKAVCNGKGPQIKEEEADRILAEYAAERKIKLLHQGSTSTSQSFQ